MLGESTGHRHHAGANAGEPATSIRRSSGGRAQTGLAAMEPAAARASLALEVAGGDVWSWTKRLSGTCAGIGADAVIEMLVNGASQPVKRVGDAFSATVRLRPGENTVGAIATSGNATFVSSPVVHMVRLSPRPTARIVARVTAAGVHLDGAGSEPSAYDAAPVTSHAWSARRSSPDPAPLPIPGISASALTLPIPGMDGEYCVSLAITDSLGRHDTATAMVAVERGRARIVDPLAERPAWTLGATVYGVVVRNVGADGFRSVIDRLDDLADLGIAALWLAPINVTVPGDFGYGIVDYFDVRPEYGTLEDFRSLVREAHARDIRVLMDIVPNHTSIEHPYYRDAERNGPASAYYGFYDRDDRGEPTHYFGWSHLPNLDFGNPEVRRFITEALMFWVRDLDVDGFRLDVAWGVERRCPEFWPAFSAEFNRVKPDGLLIAEASARDPFYINNGFDAAYDWTDELGVWAWAEVFAGEAPIPAAMIEALTNRAGGGYDPKSFIFRFLNNNDTGVRFITTHGVDCYRVASAMLLTLPGLPCIYTGDEVGAEFEPYAVDGPIDLTDRHGLRPHFRRLIHLRKELAGMRSPHWTALACEPAERILGYARSDAGGGSPVLVLLNFSPEATVATIDPTAEGAAGPMTDRYNGEPVTLGSGSGTGATIAMPPWGIRILTPA